MPTTRWSEVAKAGDPATGKEDVALANLLRRYQAPLTGYLRRRFRCTSDEALEVFQSFVEKKILLGGWLREVRREKGRFRGYLLQSINHFYIQEQRHAAALKRRPESGLVSLEERVEAVDLVENRHAVTSFDLDWARGVLAQAVAGLEEECRHKGRPEIWKLFQGRVLDPILDGAPALSYEALVADLGLESPAVAANLLVTAKRIFVRQLRAVIGAYEGNPERVEDEIRELKWILSQL